MIYNIGEQVNLYVEFRRMGTMKVMIITSSPNKNGLTAACGDAARLGAEEGKWISSR